LIQQVIITLGQWQSDDAYIKRHLSKSKANCQFLNGVLILIIRSEFPPVISQKSFLYIFNATVKQAAPVKTMNRNENV
jgi:hypothetical protein